MASKLNPWGVCRNLSVRSRPLLLSCTERHIISSFPVALRTARRGLADSTTLRQGNNNNNNTDSSIPPRAAREYVPPPAELFAPNWLNAEALAQLEKAAAGEDLYDEDLGHKFGMPALAGKNDQLQNRYPEVIDQVTKLLMRDGKLSAAERNMAMILNFLRTSPAPKVNPLRPLLPGSPPPEQLPLNPVLYLTLAIDSVAPLLRVRSMKGMAGGGMALELPEPLTARQRRRVAVLWILDVVNKKQSRGSGRTQFAARVADEIIAVVEGKSAVWDRRQILHKLGTAARANLNHPSVASKRGR